MIRQAQPRGGAFSAVCGGVCAAAISVLFLGFVASLRFIARDEGFYTVAAMLVARGQEVYRDFFYPQMPLYPTLLAWWLQLTGEGWLAARWFSVLTSAAAIGILSAHLISRGKTLAALFFCILTLSANNFYPWFVLAKTYGPTFLCFAIAFIALTSGASVAWRAFIFGACIGIATAMRLPCAGLLVAPLAYAEFRRLRPIIWLALGALLPLIAVAFHAVSDLDRFVFNNFGYHAIREVADQETVFVEKLSTLAALFGVRTGRQLIGAQFTIVAILALAAAITNLRRRERLEPSLLFGIFLFMIHLTPTPIYLQYFATVIPWFAFAGALYLADLSLRFRQRVAVTALAVIAYLAPTPEGLVQYTRSGAGVLGVDTEARADSWRISAMPVIAEAIQKNCDRDRPVLALWPGHLFGTSATPVRGFENQFALQKASLGLLAEDRARFHIPNLGDTHDLVRRGDISCLVTDRKTAKRYRLLPLIHASYYEVAAVHDIVMYHPSPARRDIRAAISKLRAAPVAHRGDRTVGADNTLAGLRSLASGGVKMIEVDVRLSSERVALLYHNRRIAEDVITQDPALRGAEVARLTMSDISRLRLRSSKGTEPIPTLEDALHLARELGLILFLDIKEESEPTIELISQLLRDSGSEGAVIAQTQSIEALRSWRLIAPEIAVLARIHAPSDLLPALEAHPEVVQTDLEALSDDTLRRIRGANAQALIKVVDTAHDTPEGASNLGKRGVALVLTDHALAYSRAHGIGESVNKLPR